MRPDSLEVLSPGIEIRILRVLGEGLEVIESSPVLNPRTDAELLVAEETLLRDVGEVVEHVLDALVAAEVPKAANESEWIGPRADDEDDEVAFDLCGEPSRTFECVDQAADAFGTANANFDSS